MLGNIRFVSKRPQSLPATVGPTQYYWLKRNWLQKRHETVLNRESCEFSEWDKGRGGKVRQPLR